MSMRGIRYTEMSSTNALSSVTTAQDVEHVSQVETQEPPNDVPEMGREILANPLLLEHESGYPDEDLFLGMDLDEDDDGQPEEQQRNARRLDEPRLDCGWPQALWRMTEEEQIKYYQCVICWESIKGLPEDRFLRLFCGEAYCADCINTAFEFSLRFESNFPLRCACKNIITLEDVLHVVATDLIDRYDQVVPEWTSPHRTYCAHCFQYLDSVIFREDARYASCTTCNKSTCRDCKSSKDKHSGNGDTCPKDSERQQVLNLAASLNWKKCGKCGILIEKSQGCNYIACICGHSFCYLCGHAPYGVHDCVTRTFFNDNLLTCQGLEWQQYVLDDRGEPTCPHTMFDWSNGQGRCEGACRQLMHWYLNGCRNCGLMVCNWCRDNRRFVRDGPEPGRGSPTREGDVERGSDGADEAKAVVSVTNSNASSEKTPQQPNPNSIETAMARASLLDTESETALILLRRPRTTTTSPLATQQHHD